MVDSSTKLSAGHKYTHARCHSSDGLSGDRCIQRGSEGDSRCDAETKADFIEEEEEKPGSNGVWVEILEEARLLLGMESLELEQRER